MAFINGKNTATGEKIDDLFVPEDQEEKLEPSNNEQECMAFANFLMEDTKKLVEEEGDIDRIAVMSSEARNWASLSIVFGEA